MTRRELRANAEPAQLSGYQLMWMLVTFDLPVDTPKQRKAATRFRNDLLDLGFEMSQFSNYLRFCSGKEQFEAYVKAGKISYFLSGGQGMGGGGMGGSSGSAIANWVAQHYQATTVGSYTVYDLTSATS